MSDPLHAPAPRNRILASLPAGDLRRLLPLLELRDLELRRVVVEVNQPIEHVWFPEAGVVSLLGVMEDGTAVETATVGNEGMVGLPVFLGADSMAGQAFCQVTGQAYRMPAGALREEVRRGGPLAELLGRYTQALFTQIAQSSACNRVHPVAQRCARWLLLTHDRVGRDTFDLTHLFLAQMLGVRRATVTEVAGALQARGVIEYTRGVVRIVDRAGLERESCECYRVIAAEFARLLEGRSLPSPLDHAPVSEHGLSTAGDGAPRADGGTA
ncbi:MAG TPA: Crp/Fnr family transcriptional regulator [Longimicrobium sp.]|nr:Crp/Fnr family transcriptional regulator [Longimicrobium sp.]